MFRCGASLLTRPSGKRHVLRSRMTQNHMIHAIWKCTDETIPSLIRLGRGCPYFPEDSFSGLSGSLRPLPGEQVSAISRPNGHAHDPTPSDFISQSDHIHMILRLLRGNSGSFLGVTEGNWG